LSKTYLDGKVTLKEPTLEGLCGFGELLSKYDYNQIIAGEGLLKLLPLICEFKEGFDFKGSEMIGIATKVLEDFFTIWNPTKWISGNMAVLTKSLKLLRASQTQKDSKKP
jgi:hypothetical protein